MCVRMSTLGDILSTVEVFSTVGDIMSTVGVILSIVGDAQYHGGIMMTGTTYLI